MDLPLVNPKRQRRPALRLDAVNTLVSKSGGDEQALYVLLAATGMRISEALALETKHFVNGGRTIEVAQQVDRDTPRVVRYPDDGAKTHGGGVRTAQEPHKKATGREVEMLRRWMLFIDGENFTIRGQEFASKNNLTLKAGDYRKKDCFLWMPNPRPLKRPDCITGEVEALDPDGLRAYWKGFSTLAAARASGRLFNAQSGGL
jgi:integrase